ncbi:hypothetical protein ERJ75_001125100 [Trypanosoma vivax]|uniref:Trypanosoma Tc-38 (p38) protein domain-containing protein n=1 Tax=Trypanosoma vivax (strain Y486) TaxID=1055687 RepID=G0TW04_TRYVY|nr:hypothetical protein ERJ75_001125100 [Trypanosoma vivax]CCC48120.1 conserved hypothetical protein [Trypanosoma vivax Y486]
MFVSTARRCGLCATAVLRDVCSGAEVPPFTAGALAPLAAPMKAPDAATGQSTHLTVLEGLHNMSDKLLSCAATSPDLAAHLSEGVLCSPGAPPEDEVAYGTGLAEQATPQCYEPVNLRGFPYDGEIACQLREAGRSMCFRSPVWATAAALMRSGYTVNDGERGVDIATAMQIITLYNLQQTDAKEAAWFSVASQYQFDKNVALSAAGRPQPVFVQRILRTHPLSALYASRYWVCEITASVLGTAVKREHHGCGVLIAPQPTTQCYGGGKVQEAIRPAFMLYNAEQLDDPLAVTSETCTPITCMSVEGRYYGVLPTVLMRLHCERYGLSTCPFATFATAYRVRSLGGDTCDDGPPPLTCVFDNEVVSLYHADQTTIAEVLRQTASRNMRAQRNRLMSVPV